MEVLGIVTDIAVALLTGALALAAFLEIRQSQAARRRDYFNSELGRLLELEGSDFLFGMRFSLDSWQQDRDLGRVIDEMRRNYAGRREQFRELALSLRPALVTHREALVQAHPETDDGGHIGQYLVGLDDHLSLQRFDKLAKGAELELNDPRFVSTDTAYNSPPRQGAPGEEPTPEASMLEILHRRHNALEEQETLHGRRLDTALRDEFRHLNYRFSSLLNDFVSWKRVAPDSAMRELLKAKRALDNLSPDPEFDLNLTLWTDSLRYGGVYNAMYAPERLDPRQLHDTQQQVALYKQLLRRAAVGLRSAFEVNTSPVRYARSLLARASEYTFSSMRFAGTYKEPASLGEVVNLSPPRASDANEYFSPKVVDLSPPRALDAAEHFLVGQGYIVTYQSVTTLIAEREDHKSATRQKGALKLLVIALPQPEGGVRIKVRGKARKGVGELQARWTEWIASLPTRQPPPTVRVKVVPMERSGRLSGVRRILSTDVILALVVFIALLATLTMVGLAISLLF